MGILKKPQYKREKLADVEKLTAQESCSGPESGAAPFAFPASRCPLCPGDFSPGPPPRWAVSKLGQEGWKEPGGWHSQSGHGANSRRLKKPGCRERNGRECQWVEQFSRKMKRPGGSWSTPGRKKLVVSRGRDVGVLRAVS